jgi:hypothetical protein
MKLVFVEKYLHTSTYNQLTYDVVLEHMISYIKIHRCLLTFCVIYYLGHTHIRHSMKYIEVRIQYMSETLYTKLGLPS